MEQSEAHGCIGIVTLRYCEYPPPAGSIKFTVQCVEKPARLECLVPRKGDDVLELQEDFSSPADFAEWFRLLFNLITPSDLK